MVTKASKDNGFISILYAVGAKDIERDFYMTATEAKEYGIVDKVMPKRVSSDKEAK